MRGCPQSVGLQMQRRARSVPLGLASCTACRIRGQRDSSDVQACGVRWQRQ